MRTIGTPWESITNEDKQNRTKDAKDIGKAKWLRKREKEREFRNSRFTVELHLGGKKTGEVKEMTGLEFLIRNKKYREAFWKELDKNEHARMYEWKIRRTV